MFELNGKEYSLQDVEQAAASSNLSLDEYIKKAGLKTIEPGKTNGVAETGATVTPTTGQAPEIIDNTGAPEVTGFKPVESSLGSKWTDNFVELEGVQFDDGAIGLAAIELEGVTVTADQYKKVEQDIENEGAKQVEEQVISMSPGDIKVKIFLVILKKLKT
jgi:hypothetical protein